MKLRWQRSLRQNLRAILQAAGYHHFADPVTGLSSYIMRVSRDHYPRYHLYVTELTKGIIELDLHFDQKKARHQGVRAHVGEYDGAAVQSEMGRIGRWLNYYSKHDPKQR